jgi:hypothetical protein
LIAEIQALRREVAELRQERQLEAPKIDNEARQEAQQHGLLVRLAMWGERRWRKLRDS